MRSTLLAAGALAAGMFSQFSDAGVAQAYFPQIPTVTSPAYRATDVEQPLAIESSAMVEADQSGTPTTGNLTFAEASWIFYQRDDSITYIFGRRGDDQLDLQAIGQDIVVYSVPEGLDLEFNGLTVSKLRISNQGNIDLLTDTDSEIGEITYQPDRTWATIPSNSTKTFVKAFEDYLLINTAYSTDTYTNDAIIQIFIADNGNILIRTSPNDLSSNFFSSSNSSFGVNLGNQTLKKSLSEWKTTLTNNQQTDFGLVFNINESNLLVAQIPTVFDIASNVEPAIVSETVSSITADLSSSLEAGTEYFAQVRHKATNGSNQPRYSNWSGAVNFTTALNSEYEISELQKPATIITGTPVKLSMKVSNTGTDGGQPRAEIKLPFNAISNLNGTLSDFFAAKVANNGSDSTSNCSVNVVNDETYVSCTLSMDSQDSEDFEATFTFYEAGQQSYAYRVCETKLNRCDDAAFTSESITVQATSGPSGNNGGSSDSSSSGGALAVLLLAAPFLRRRYASK